MSLYDNENKIIEAFQAEFEEKICMLPNTHDVYHILTSIYNKENWIKWNNSSKKNDPPPDFYNDELKIMMDVMRIDDHAFKNEKGKIINPTLQKENELYNKIINSDFIKSRKREKMYEKLSKNALLNMYFGTITGTIAILAIIFVLELLFVIPNNIGILVILGLIIAIILVFNAIISPVFRFHRYRYKIDEESIDIIEGYVFTQRNIVPIERLHKLQISQGPFDKLCNVARVKVTTAGGDVEIRFLENEKAEKITESLKQKINQIAVEQKNQIAKEQKKRNEEEQKKLNETQE